MTTGQMNEMTVEQKEGQKETLRHLDAFYWGGVILWAGLVFGADALDILPQIGQADAWSWVFLGAGVFATLGNLYRMSTPDYPNPTSWDWVWGGIFLILGLGGFIAFNISWPLILVLVGVVILGKAFVRRG